MKNCTLGEQHAIMDGLLPFFSFLEEPQSLQEECSSYTCALQVLSLPASMAWAAPPSALQKAIRFYLAARWGCSTRQQGEREEICLSPRMEAEQDLHLFLAALRRFYRFAMERRDYWYGRNPAEAFRLPLRSRLLRAITPKRFSRRSRPARNQKNVDEVIRQRPEQTVREPQGKVPVVSI